jgi:hypothetical protein
MNCPICEGRMSIELELIGGCEGHYGEDSRCYCDSPDVRCRFICNNQYKRNGKTFYCKQEPMPIYELGDKGAIQRWLNAHFRK